VFVKVMKTMILDNILYIWKRVHNSTTAEYLLTG
jgi:hypothetical protein